jgi:hypothetical protein
MYNGPTAAPMRSGIDLPQGRQARARSLPPCRGIPGVRRQALHRLRGFIEWHPRRRRQRGRRGDGDHRVHQPQAQEDRGVRHTLPGGEHGESALCSGGRPAEVYHRGG